MVSWGRKYCFMIGCLDGLEDGVGEKLIGCVIELGGRIGVLF